MRVRIRKPAWLGPALAAGTLLLGSCSSMSPSDAVVMYPAEVGSRTPLFEVVSSSRLKLAPGASAEPAEGPCGPRSGMVLRRANGDIGGYVVCGCHSATQGSCTTTSDNPNYPSCAGGCRNSEGVPVGCEIYGPLIGPPRTPLQIRLRARP